MSLKATTWVAGLEIRPSLRKFVLLAFASYSGDTGLTHPKLTTICKFTSLPTENVQKEINDLAASGLMTNTGKKFDGNDVFQIHRTETVPTVTRELQGRLPDMPPATPAAPAPRKKKKLEGPLIADAEKVYAIYPRRLGGTKAIQSIVKALQRFDFQIVYDGTKAFSDAWKASGKEKEFCPHATTFFNQDRFTATLEDLGLKSIKIATPKNAEISAYLHEKIDDITLRARIMAGFIHQWSPKKWMRDGVIIDWRVELSAFISRVKTQEADKNAP